MTTANEVLERASQLLDERGWCQGDLEDSEGRLCILGSIKAAWRELGEPKGIMIEAIDRVYALGHMPGGVAGYNDKPSTTKEDIQLLLKRSAQ